MATAATSLPDYATPVPLRPDERVQALVELTRGPRVLHVGCVDNWLPLSKAQRQGWAHDALLAAGFSVLGGDIDEQGLDWMREQGYEVTSLNAEAMDLDERFDSIVAGELIEHLARPGDFLASAKRQLKPGGRLVLSTPNPFSIFYSLLYAKEGAGVFNPEHTAWFCEQTLRQLLAREGFEIEELRFVDLLRTDLAVGLPYRLFAFAWRRVREFLPRRYRNTLVVAARVADPS